MCQLLILSGLSPYHIYLTMDVASAEAINTGTITSITSASFQPMMKPWTNAKMKQANSSMALENFSPIPSTILCMTLDNEKVHYIFL